MIEPPVRGLPPWVSYLPRLVLLLVLRHLPLPALVLLPGRLEGLLAHLLLEQLRVPRQVEVEAVAVVARDLLAGRDVAEGAEADQGAESGTPNKASNGRS